MLHRVQVDPALHQCVSNGARGKELRVKFGKEGEQNEGRKGRERRSIANDARHSGTYSQAAEAQEVPPPSLHFIENW